MTTDLQTRIAAIKAECEEIIRLSGKATPGPWIFGNDAVWSDTNGDGNSPSEVCYQLYQSDAAFIASSRNVSPAMARVVIATISHWEKVATVWSSENGMLAQLALEEIANQWEGK